MPRASDPHPLTRPSSSQAAAKQGAREVAESLLGWYTELHDAAVLDAGQGGVRITLGQVRGTLRRGRRGGDWSPSRTLSARKTLLDHLHLAPILLLSLLSLFRLFPASSQHRQLQALTALQALAAADITLFLPHKDPAQYVKSLSPYLKVRTVWYGPCGGS